MDIEGQKKGDHNAGMSGGTTDKKAPISTINLDGFKTNRPYSLHVWRMGGGWFYIALMSGHKDVETRRLDRYSIS